MEPHADSSQDYAAQQLTNCQSQLYAFIVSLMGRSSHAQDVLQETNLALWRRLSEYDCSRPFLAWAFTYARFQVLAWRKRQSGNRLIYNDSVYDLMAQTMCEPTTPNDVIELEALELCLERLGTEQRALLDRCYMQDEDVQNVAKDLKRSVSGLSVTLHRLRRTLLDCVRSRLAMEQAQ